MDQFDILFTDTIADCTAQKRAKTYDIPEVDYPIVSISFQCGARVTHRKNKKIEVKQNNKLYFIFNLFVCCSLRRDKSPAPHSTVNQFSTAEGAKLERQAAPRRATTHHKTPSMPGKLRNGSLTRMKSLVAWTKNMP